MHKCIILFIVADTHCSYVCCFLQSGTKAPRQPWHDLHCRIDGAAAYDVLINFEQRWRKATKWKEFAILFKQTSQWNDDALIRLERISWILSPSQPSSKNKYTIVPEDDPVVWVSSEDDPENWHVQVGHCKLGS